MERLLAEYEIEHQGKAEDVVSPLAPGACRVRLGRPALGVPVPSGGRSPSHGGGSLRRAAHPGAEEEVRVGGIPLGPARPEGGRHRRPSRLRAGTVRRSRARGGRGAHARDGGRALRGRREAARPGRAAGPHPEVRRGRRRAAPRARQARRPRLGEAEVLGQEGREGHRRPAPEALCAPRGRARARVLEGLALAEGVRGGVRVHGDARPGRGDPRREAGHGVGQADGPAVVRRRGIREDRGRDAGDLQVRARRQAGGASCAHDDPLGPALPHVEEAVRGVSRSRSTS